MVVKRMDMIMVFDLVEQSKTKLISCNDIKEKLLWLTKEVSVYTKLHVRVNPSQRQLQEVSVSLG